MSKAAFYTYGQLHKKLLDMHTHIYSHDSVEQAAEEMLFRRRNNIFSVYNCAEPGQWDFMQQVFQMAAPAKEPCRDLLSFGIHPWNSHRFRPADWMDLYRQCDLIGEIGMDTLWCEVPVPVQRKVFEEQLQIAADLHKPVVLHTKDCERQILDMLAGFAEPVLVHWYAGDEQTLLRYRDAGCWFTLGPDTAICAQRMLLHKLPADRLFTETDGLEAILWVYENQKENTEPSYSLLPRTLQASLSCMAQQMQTEKTAALDQMWYNFAKFCQIEQTS